MRWFGETLDQRDQREQNGVRAFAYVPVQLDSGEWVWWEYYWVYLRFGLNHRPFWHRFATELEMLANLHEFHRLRTQRPPPPAE